MHVLQADPGHDLRGPLSPNARLGTLLLTVRSASAVGSLRPSLISRHGLDCRHLGQHSFVSMPTAPRCASFKVLQLSARCKFFPHGVRHPRGLAACFLAHTSGHLWLQLRRQFNNKTVHGSTSRRRSGSPGVITSMPYRACASYSSTKAAVRPMMKRPDPT